MQTVLITGANGFVGSYLTKLLIPYYRVFATGKGACRLDINHPNFRYKSLDFTEQNEVKNLLSDLQADVIVHAGALSKPDDCELNKELAYHTNVKATSYLLSEAARAKSF